ncbi:MAG: DUF559 domain-containing protein [Candidatus Omnitrophota bacterium]
MKRNVNDLTKQRARELRQNLSPAEKRLWACLRAKQIFGLHIRRQHPIGPYLADFSIEKLKLVIELDGISHDFKLEEDAKRDQYMLENGYEVYRILNRDVMMRLEDVIESIRNICKAKLS